MRASPSDDISRHLILILFVCLFGMEAVYQIFALAVEGLADATGSEALRQFAADLMNGSGLADFIWGCTMLATAAALALILKSDNTLGEAAPAGVFSLHTLRLTTLVFVLDHVLCTLLLKGFDLFSPDGEASIIRPGYEYDISPQAFPVDVFTTVIAAPVAEEFLYRGALLSALLARGLSGWLTILISSGLFAISHVQYEWQGVVLVFVSGCFLGFLRLQTGGLLMPVLCHAAINAWVILQEYLPVFFGTDPL